MRALIPRAHAFAALVAAFGCESSPPPDYATVSGVMEASCARCHSAAGIDALLTAVAALPPDGFDATRFPPTAFHVGLRPYTTEDLAEEDHIESGMPTEQAWILHELNELDALLAEEVPPDYTGEAPLDAFILYMGGGYTEGCELLDKVDRGAMNDPEGMPPPWAAPLMALLDDVDYRSPSLGERDAVLAYTEGVLGPEDLCPQPDP